MTWQKGLRLVLAAAGLGTAAAIYMLMRPQPAPPPAPPAITIDPNAQVETGAGQTIRFVNGDRKGTLTYTAVRQYKDGRAQYDGFRYEMADGALMTADLVEMSGTSPSGERPQQITAQGHVRVKTPGGASLESDTGTFDDANGIAIMPGAVTFVHDKASGSGTHGVWDQKTGRLTLETDTHVTMTPADPAASPVDISSVSLVYLTIEKVMTFDGQAVVTRATETLSSDRTTMYLAEDGETFKSIELRGHSAVTPVAGKSSDLPAMRAGDIDLIFYPATSSLQAATLRQDATMVLTGATGQRSIEGAIISFQTAPDGKTLTRLEARERAVVRTPANGSTPERKISSDIVVAQGNEREGLKLARFEGHVEFLELVKGDGGATHPRTGTSGVLTAAISGQFETIDNARFERDVKFRDGDVVGDADVGIYHASRGELELLPLGGTSRKFPHAEDGTVSVDAKESIHVNLNTTDITARRDVNTVSRRRSADTPGAPAAALFNDRDPLYGSGAEFTYASASRTAQYRGTAATPARLTQGGDGSVISADEIVFSDEKQDLTATGRVDAAFTMAPGRAPEPPRRYRARADTLRYVEAARTSTFTGSPAVLTETNGSETRADTLVLVLEAESRALQSLHGTGRGSVRMTLKEGRQAEGDDILYRPGEGVYILQGTPLTLITRDTDGTCTVQRGNYATFDESLGAPDFPAARNISAPSQSGQRCPPTLPPPKQ